jgi:hypothetical protein
MEREERRCENQERWGKVEKTAAGEIASPFLFFFVSPLRHGLAPQVGHGHRLIAIYADVQAGQVGRLPQAGAQGGGDELFRRGEK